MPTLPMPRDALTVALALAVLAVTFLIVWASTLDPEAARLRRRLRVIGQTRTAGGQRPSAAPAATSVKRDLQRSWLGPGAGAWLPRSSSVADRLVRAGVNLGVPDFLILCLASGLGMAMWLHLTLALSWVLSCCAGLVMATGIPHVWLGSRIASRSRRFVTLLPDAIDLIVRGLRSGLPATEALQAIANEVSDPVGSVFREVVGGLRLGMSVDQALWAAANRLRIPEMKFLVISISIQQETGGNLAEILQNLSHMIRRRQQLRLKVKAMSSEARASAMIIGSLPFIMGILIYLVNPDYIMQLWTDPRGWMLVVAGVVSLGLGVAVMARMVKFEL